MFHNITDNTSKNGLKKDFSYPKGMSSFSVRFLHVETTTAWENKNARCCKTIVRQYTCWHKTSGTVCLFRTGVPLSWESSQPTEASLEKSAGLTVE